MNKYILYFKVFDKKFKTTIFANSYSEAETKLTKLIITKTKILKTQKEPDDKDVMNDIFNLFRK